MSDWSFLGRLLTQVQNHSTVVGKVWLTVLLVFRILLVTLVGDAVYGDEQSKFTCNTLQPGCTNVCYDRFSPVSHFRFWVFQIVLVATPSIFYVIYVLHQIAREERVDMERECLLDTLQKLASGGALQRPRLGLLGSSHFREGQLLMGERVLPRCLGAAARNPGLRSQRVLAIYIAHVVLRAFMELAFLVGQYYLFGFDVPYLFHCHSYPCPTSTDCFVSRATEKMIFLNFMFGVGVGCFLLNLAELHYLGWVFTCRFLFAACTSCYHFCGQPAHPPLLYSDEDSTGLQVSLCL